MIFDLFGQTHVGWRRENNEDAYLFTRRADHALLAVADGLGGHHGGEVASALALATVDASEGTSSDLVLIAQEQVLGAARAAGSNMGSTVTLACIKHDGDLDLSWVGDSRAYLLHGEELLQLSTDDTVAAQLQQTGRLSAAEAAQHPSRHQLIQHLGSDQAISVHHLRRQLVVGDRLLLCSDGLNGQLGDEVITELIKNATSAADACNQLIQAVLGTAARDNVTVVVAFIS